MRAKADKFNDESSLAVEHIKVIIICVKIISRSRFKVSHNPRFYCILIIFGLLNSVGSANYQRPGSSVNTAVNSCQREVIGGNVFGEEGSSDTEGCSVGTPWYPVIPSDTEWYSATSRLRHSCTGPPLCTHIIFHKRHFYYLPQSLHRSTASFPSCPDATMLPRPLITTERYRPVIDQCHSSATYITPV